MKTRSAVVVIALVCAGAGASGCGPGLEPPKASTGSVPTTPGVLDHGGLPSAGSAAGLAGAGAALAADAGAPIGSGGAGGGKAGHAGQGAAGASGDAGVDEDAGY